MHRAVLPAPDRRPAHELCRGDAVIYPLTERWDIKSEGRGAPVGKTCRVKREVVPDWDFRTSPERDICRSKITRFMPAGPGSWSESQHLSCGPVLQ